MPIQRGKTVRQIVPVIQGEVKEPRFNESQNQMEYLVGFTDADGEPAERWFLESEVEVVETPTEVA